jgi:DMSO/TMAO reductase YedYZ molybdopterin-dependent catalytic subunit
LVLFVGLIDNEEIFADIVQNRSLTTHTYDEDLANEIYQKFDGYYLTLSGLVKRKQLIYFKNLIKINHQLGKYFLFTT